MEKTLLAFAMLLILSAPVFAESAREICNEEALDAGITEQEEISFYVKECVAQMNGDMEAERTEVEEGERDSREDGSSEEGERSSSEEENGTQES